MVNLTDSSATAIKSYDYDAFVVERNIASSDANPFRYCAEYYDKETGEIYLRARYYNASIGRFTQQDGWGYADSNDPLSLNLYVYCVGNPVMYVDPSGNALIHWLAIAGIIVTGLTVIFQLVVQ
ncbi:MAG: RHS repeat-associated core domain-containing protein [Oscillospiraceae bacterium]|nr:RHS repeat-associated core domain-containing protein [Oscillospiraceae bacterium]